MGKGSLDLEGPSQGKKKRHRLTAAALGCHLDGDLLDAGLNVELALAPVGVPVGSAHQLRGGDALGGTHAPARLGLADGTKLALPTAVCKGRGEIWKK